MNKLTRMAIIFAAGGIMTLSANDKLQGTGDIIARAKRGDAITAVFFGGSLTSGANASNPSETSWRGNTMKMLRKRYPKTPWRFYDAAIGGTGTDLAIFRLQRDVLAQKPDLVFLEFTLNDGLKGSSRGMHDSANQSYETILRICLKKGIAVLPVFLTSKKYVTMKELSELKRRLQHIEIFKKYNLDYADVLGTMHSAYHSKKLDITGFWPKEVFDMTHPQDPGYKAYADFFAKEWQRIEKKPCGKPVIPAKPLSGNEYAHFVRIDAPSMKIKGAVTDYLSVQADNLDWLSSRWLDRVAMIGNADHTSYFDYTPNGKKSAQLTFSFYGERVGITSEVIKESAPLLVSVDGSVPREVNFRKVRITQYQPSLLAVGLDPKKKHTITIKLKLPADGSAGVLRLGSIHINGSYNAEIVP